MPGAFNAITAKLVEEAGFEAVYISGAGLANSVAALPDIGLLSMNEVVTQTSYIVGAVGLPCIVDIDTGFGGVPNVMRTVEELEHAGAAGLQIEDQKLPKKCGHLPDKTIVSSKDMCEKIAAAKEASADPDFMIIARTDAKAIEGISGAIKRANMYVAAGAGCIFPEALETREEFALFRKEVSAPLLANMTEFGKTPYMGMKEFEDMGINIVIFPLTAMRVMLKAVQEALAKLKAEGTQQNFINSMLTRKELYKLLDYDGYNEVDKKIANRIERKEGGEGK